ncbi:MAG: hypothetical protein BWK80_28700 [Desulfobacteraceae bacterium IS3]|nr:MAG: hypothetical protein BWK80_28700 [Desulfobacteraceae bacterium IS3]
MRKTPRDNTAFLKPQSFAKFSAKLREAVQRYVLKLRGSFFGQSGIRPRNSRIYLCVTLRKTPRDNTAFLKPQSFAKFSAKLREAVQLRGPFFGQSGIRPRNSRIYLCATLRKTPRDFAVRSEMQFSTA